jgi:hypothetical protein
VARAIQEIALAAEGKGCLGRCHPDEPVFILCARDAVASEVVRFWAKRVGELAQARKIMTPERRAKIEEAEKLADMMDAWHTHKLPD